MSTGTIPTLDTLGTRLRISRTLMSPRVSHERMAELLAGYGIKRKHASISKWERNINLPRGKELLKIINAWATITGVDVRWLMGGGEWVPSSEDSRSPRNFTSRNRKGQRPPTYPHNHEHPDQALIAN